MKFFFGLVMVFSVSGAIAQSRPVYENIKKSNVCKDEKCSDSASKKVTRPVRSNQKGKK